jgi:hypothetical protein
MRKSVFSNGNMAGPFQSVKLGISKVIILKITVHSVMLTFYLEYSA